MESEASGTQLAGSAKRVQDYIDETPLWADGTPVGHAPMTTMQWRIWWLAAFGKFFEGLVVFMTAVALPLIAVEFDMSATQHGVVGAASLAGILVGALALGGLSDTFGRKFMFVVEMIIFMIFLVLLALSPSYPWLVVFLFGVGVALGCDYPTAHLIISESIPSSARGRLVLGAFGFQALGALAGSGVGYMVLVNLPDISAWRWMYASAILPAALVTIGRFYITESAPWLFAHGRFDEAEREAAKLLKRDPAYPHRIKLARSNRHARRHVSETGWSALFGARNRRATILASVPWFLQDLGTYGIGLFTPTILAAALGHAASQAHDVTDIIANQILAAEGAALIDALLIVGIVGAVVLSDRVGRIPLQALGFVGCATGLLLAAFSTHYADPVRTALIFAGFMLFNFMTNLGPNAQTYLLAGEVFPTHVRGKGAGFAAAFGKIGAVLTAFLFPILLAEIGTTYLLYGLAGTSLLGAAVTWRFRIETRGINLDRAHEHAFDADLDAAAGIGREAA
ncbi:MFS transporter [Ancylobacter defluvii]|uniref:MFS transporter n=1 Tax=Ancylobacter defluvii TaxID=1282440 RepID=A0A9W6JZS6_9HYPH|nr:MFS transporter [Ancylobacter defluvii]GLK86272.1 MFS transporter [Ancylobacter defluvii]